jgi:hypothetical protein
VTARWPPPSAKLTLPIKMASYLRLGGAEASRIERLASSQSCGLDPCHTRITPTPGRSSPPAGRYEPDYASAGMQYFTLER